MKKYAIENKIYWVSFIKTYIISFVNTILAQYPTLGNKKKAAKIAFQYCKDLEIPDNIKNDPEFESVILEVSNLLGGEYGDFWNTEGVDIDADEFLEGGDINTGVGVVNKEENKNDLNLFNIVEDYDEKEIVYDMIQKLLDDYNKADKVGDENRKNEIKNRIDELRELL